MFKYCLVRILRAMISLVLVITVVFCLLRMMPVEGYFSNIDKMSEADIHNALEALGLNDPLPEQLGRFFTQLAQGDLGKSIKYRQNYPIAKIVAKKAPYSIQFGLWAMAISLPLGFGLGILMARYKGKWVDKLGTAYIVIIQAVPAAIYYLFMQLYGSSATGWSLLYNPSQWTSMILPILSLAMPSIAGYAMWIRRFMLDEANKDYVLMAKAKGVPGRAIAFHHIFRNGVVPMVQQLPGSLLLTICGSIYIESLYSIPGMGGLLVEVIKMQDNTMVQALVIIYAVLGIFGLLIGDLLMALLDPRINLAQKGATR